MDYNVILNAHSYKLAPYSTQIADEIESHRDLKKSLTKAEYRNTMYQFLVRVLNDEVVKEVIGSPLVYDPNTLYTAYDMVIDAYEKPYRDYKAGEVVKMLRGSKEVLDVAKLIPALSQLNND